MAKLFANSEDPDQMPGSAASGLGLHYLPITLLGVSPTSVGKQHINSCGLFVSSSRGREKKDRSASR